MCQSELRRARTMLRLSLLVILLTHRIRTAYITDTPSFADRLDRLYERLEKLTVAPSVKPIRELGDLPEEKLYAKLDRLNSLTPDKLMLNADDEELLRAMQMWGMLSAEQLGGVVKELQGMRLKGVEEKNEPLDADYGDSDWNDVDMQDLADGEYAMDGSEDWDADEDPETGSSTSKPLDPSITPSAIIRSEPGYKETFLSAVDPIAATNERPKILEDASLTAAERSALRRAALANMGSVVRAGKCLIPQPRWLAVRQLAPAADTVYMPPCVQLHRCAPDSGCCYSEAEVCAPVDGKYVAIPFYLNKADGNFTVARMLFFNHTRCACVSRETLQSTTRTKVEVRQNSGSQERRESVKDMQNEWRAPTEEPRLERDEERTAPPQLRRCTCPALFLGRMSEDGVCSCVCEWAEPSRRRECWSLARGREHFGLRDRACVAAGACAPPACDHGAYDARAGRCPHKRFRKVRYHARGRPQDKSLAV